MRYEDPKTLEIEAQMHRVIAAVDDAFSRQSEATGRSKTSLGVLAVWRANPTSSASRIAKIARVSIETALRTKRAFAYEQMTADEQRHLVMEAIAKDPDCASDELASLTGAPTSYVNRLKRERRKAK